jgi:outer membrane receptor protein involved in Fe transport
VKSTRISNLKYAAAPLALGIALISTPSFAQEAAPAAEAAEAIVVTGSRIARPDLTGTTPVAVVSAEEFKLAGAINVEQVINTLPQVLPGNTSFSNNPGNGAVTLNLRGIGSTRTLVLVNGRRWMFYDTNQIVDLNTIPQFLISNVDVVTGGTSAVYGSDAVSGVVNFRLRDLNGIEAGTTYSLTDKGDGERYSANIAIGSSLDDGRGNVTMFANYTRRKSIFQGARSFSATAAGDGCIVPGSTNAVTEIGTPYPSGITVSTCGTRGGQVGFVPQGSATGPIATFGSGTSTYIFNPTGGGSRVFKDPGDLYNFAPANYLQLPQERYLLGAYGNYEVTDGLEFYSELSFVNNRVASELAPTPTGVSAPLLIASPYFDAATRALLTANDAAEAATAGTRGDGYATTSVSYRFLSAGSRNQEQTRQAFRVLGGFRGDITDNLQFDMFYSYARTSNTQIQQGNVSSSRYVNALTTEFVPGSTTELRCKDASARAAGCVPINVFGSGLASADAVKYVRVQSTNLEQSELTNAVASVSGSLFNLGMGGDDVGFAFGGEYRKMASRYIPDEFLASGDVLGFNAGKPTSGSYDVKEIFGELNVPVLEDQFIHRLGLNAAARYSDYSLSAVGGSWTYSGGIDVAPIEDVTFRAQYSRAVRAPNVQDLFAGNSTGFPAATDPCSDRGTAASRTDALRAFCLAAGVPAATVFTRAVQPNAQIQADFGGSPTVEEETSDTFTAGLVFRPSFVPRLNITADYFNISVDNTIGVLAGGVSSALSLCYNTIQDLNNPICKVFVGMRNTSNGALGQTSGGKNPQFRSANVGNLETSGIDVQVDYSMPVMNGNLGFFYLGTWLDTYRSTPISSIPERENIVEGTHGQPKYRHNVRVTYSEGPALFSVRWRYEDGTKDTRIQNVFNGTQRIGTDPALLPKPYVGSTNYIDLSVGVDLNENFSLNAGVNNLFDTQPRILGSAAEQGNTLPSFYDVLGRDYFVSARFKF